MKGSDQDNNGDDMVIMFDYEKMPESIHSIIFTTQQQELVAKMLINFIKEQGTISRSDMSNFANNLHEGTIVAEILKENQKETIKISYNKKQFYDRIVTPMKTMGLIEYDQTKKVYRLSERFHQAMSQIGQLWLDAVRNQEENPIKVMI